MSVLGYAWLLEKLNLPAARLVVTSRLGTRLRETQRADGTRLIEYPQQYEPEPSIAGHLVFALKHEGLDLALLQGIFRAISPDQIAEYIRQSPTGRYARLLGFFYEFTTGETLDPEITVGGNYINALEPQKYFVSPRPRRNRRWRVSDNLLGTPRYCPIVRKTQDIDAVLSRPLQATLQVLMGDVPAALLHRASNYLYLKETRSTYSIEHEPMPPQDRAERFISLLRSAGQGRLTDLLSEAELAARQNLIVDPRYAEPGFRTSQNYVGSSRLGDVRVHYVCPPPKLARALMKGLIKTARRTKGLHPVVRAAVVAFGFVYVHPFEDGNGRLHRFLIHDILHRDGLVPSGVILPVSATMLRRMPDYDACLEQYSRPLMDGLVKYELDGRGRLAIRNPKQVKGYYRYPDLTAAVKYLLDTVALSIDEDLAGELRFLRGYDEAWTAMREVVDMPDRRLELMLNLLHQNGGRLSKKKRSMFPELTDDEIRAMEEAFVRAFQEPGNRL